MTSQLALGLPAAAAVSGGEPLECEPGQEMVADMAAVNAMISWFGKRHDTARADVRRPIAYLYGRPAVMSADDRRQCYAASRGLFREPSRETPGERLHQLAFARGLASSGSGGDFWVRVTGEKEGTTSRELVRRVASTVQDQPWALEIAFGLGNDIARAKADEINANVLRALQLTCAGWQVMGGSGFVVPHLAPLVLALRWDAALEHAVILARHGVPPNLVEFDGNDRVDPRRTWAVLVDAALARGLPGAERLALIGQMQPSSAVVRALRWVSEQPR